MQDPSQQAALGDHGHLDAGIPDLNDDGDSLVLKRPPNAYMRFCNAKREALLQSEPNLNYKTVMARLGELWNNLSPEERQPYVDEAKRSQLEFKQRCPNYKYKPRRPKPPPRQANQLILPNGISHAEASYLMLLGAQTLLNQKGGQQMVQPIQLPGDDPSRKNKGKDDLQPQFPLNDIPFQLSSLQLHQPLGDKMAPANALNAAMQLQAQNPGNPGLSIMSTPQAGFPYGQPRK